MLCAICLDCGHLKHQPCTCLLGKIYALNLSLAGPKLATAAIADLEDHIANLKYKIDRLQADFAKVQQGICLDCEFWQKEFHHQREWTRELFKKLRAEIAELKK